MLAQVDKNPDSISVTCWKLAAEELDREFNTNAQYIDCSLSLEDIHTKHLNIHKSWGLPYPNYLRNKLELPQHQANPKFHKTDKDGRPILKFRFLAAAKANTNSLAIPFKIVTATLKAVYKYRHIHYVQKLARLGIACDSAWVVDSIDEVIKHIELINELMDASGENLNPIKVESFDIEGFYPNTVHYDSIVSVSSA